MNRALKFCIAVAVICLGSACETTNSVQEQFTAIDGVETRDDVLIYKLSMLDDGRLILPDVKIGNTNYVFMIDSAATRSAIYEDALVKQATKRVTEKQVNVHGMIQSGLRDLIRVENMKIGNYDLGSKSLIVLTDPDENKDEERLYDGLIGMDILENYRLFVNRDADSLTLIPNSLPPITLPPAWDKVPIKPDPRLTHAHSIHFAQIRLAGRMTPMLVDTGSGFSAMNWQAAHYRQVEWRRRKLRRQWELEGAIGQFSPTAALNLSYFRGGEKGWFDKLFIVMDFNNIEELGMADEPMVIGGIDLFKQETFLVDFAEDYLAFKPSGERLKRYEFGQHVTAGNPDDSAGRY